MIEPMLILIATALTFLTAGLVAGWFWHRYRSSDSTGPVEAKNRPDDDRTFSHLDGQLLYGGRFKGNGFQGIVALPDRTDYAIALDRGQQSYAEPDTPFVHWPISDSGVPDTETLHRLGGFGSKLIDRGNTIFIYCHAGQNRSALMVGVILHQQTKHSGDELIEIIRDENPDALRNHKFLKYLRNL